MRTVAHLAGSVYWLIIPAVYLPRSGISWTEAGMFFLSCAIIIAGAYTVFTSVFFLEDGRKAVPVIKGVAELAAGFGLIYWSGAFISTITPIQYGFLGVFVGLITAMNRPPDQEDIDALNQ